MPKASNFTSGRVQNRDTKNRRLGTIVTSIQDSKPREKQISQSFSYCGLINLLRNGTIVHCLWENKKTLEKSDFREAWSPALTSQSLPVPCFWSRGFVPHRKWNLMLLVHQNTGKENRYGKNVFAVLISTLGRFDRANKKICHIHFNNNWMIILLKNVCFFFLTILYISIRLHPIFFCAKKRKELVLSLFFSGVLKVTAVTLILNTVIL